MIEERHNLAHEVANTVLEAPLTPDVEGDGPKVAGEGRNLPGPRPTPEAKAAYQDKGRPPALNVVAYAGVFGEGHRHALLASILTPPPKRALRETSM